MQVLECDTENDVLSLGNRLREIAKENPVTVEPKYSATQEEALERAKEVDRNILKTSRFLLWNGSVISIVLTFDEYVPDTPWRLSMVSHTDDSTSRVPDCDADLLSRLLLGKPPKEISYPGPLLGVRMFVAEP